MVPQKCMTCSLAPYCVANRTSVHSDHFFDSEEVLWAPVYPSIWYPRQNCPPSLRPSVWKLLWPLPNLSRIWAQQQILGTIFKGVPNNVDCLIPQEISLCFRLSDYFMDFISDIRFWALSWVLLMKKCVVFRIYKSNLQNSDCFYVRMGESSRSLFQKILEITVFLVSKCSNMGLMRWNMKFNQSRFISDGSIMLLTNQGPLIIPP